MYIADLPKIFGTDIKIKTTKGYYYRHYINCGKSDCRKCEKHEIGHPYWYFYPINNPEDKVFFLSKPGLIREDEYGRKVPWKVHIWGKIISIYPKKLEQITGLIIHNK